MSLTPEDIENQVFKERFRGYDQDEVDRFLDRAAERIGELASERDGLGQRIRELEREVAEAGQAEELLQRTLLSAQRSADETIDEARATAEQTIEDARHQAEEIIAEARRQVGQEEQKASEVLDHVRQVIAELSRFRSQYRERIEAVIAEQLTLLDRAGDLPELPENLRSLGDVEPSRRAGVAGDDGGQVYWEHSTES